MLWFLLLKIAIGATVTLYGIYYIARTAWTRRRRKAMGRAGYLESHVDHLRRTVTKRKERRHPETFGAYYIGYLYGSTDEANRMDGEEMDGGEMALIHREVARIFGPLPTGPAADERLKAILKKSYAMRGVQDGRADIRSFAKNTGDPTAARAHLKAMEKGEQKLFGRAVAFFGREVR